MRRLLPALLLSLSAVLAACSSSSGGPGWTYAPATEAPASQPVASGDASAAPSAPPASGAPSGEAPSDGGGDGGDAVTVTAEQTVFLEAEVTAPADAPFVIRFDNRDAGVPHNVEIKDASGASIWKGEIFNGVEVRDYQVPALPAGTYEFVCTVHPNMVGTLTAGG